LNLLIACWIVLSCQSKCLDLGKGILWNCGSFPGRSCPCSTCAAARLRPPPKKLQFLFTVVAFYLCVMLCVTAYALSHLCVVTTNHIVARSLSSSLHVWHRMRHTCCSCPSTVLCWLPYRWISVSLPQAAICLQHACNMPAICLQSLLLLRCS
jgi:hypothetical protein